MQGSDNTDVTFASRYECKYLVDPMLVPEIRAYIQPFVKPDGFAALRQGNRYPICSLYLDTDDLRLYQQTVGGNKKRFKLRARTYSDNPESPVFFEVKRKVDSIVRKRRARLSRRQAALMFGNGVNGWIRELSGDLASDVEYFQSHALLSGAKPVIRVKYLREAYDSPNGEPVRITIDTDLMHAVTLDGTLSHAEGRWVTTPVDGPILEIKFTNHFPDWVGDVVRVFGLKQQAVPKYIMSVDHMLMGGRESVLSLAGFTLPALRA